MASSHRRPERCTWHIHSEREGPVGTALQWHRQEQQSRETALIPLGYDGLRDGMEAGLRPLCLEGPVRRAERMEVGLGGQERRSTRGIWPRERQESR